ncbi:hypothetical protein MTR67_022905 [Solanum verrucosum]|uniref:GRF-type domain-containing protein n=1 Tax=Solanum verrucosum TaxID=315347 RepID=A0AAF0QYP9_SOLVR|nr:hypothetical protein MTR67_022905 [Solanum verrucosum]
MSNAILNRICNNENDPMLGVKICCKHGDLLSMQTSWSKDNPGRRFWSCPCYRENACNFFRWRDREDVDIRSKFVILRLANRIKELKIDDEIHIKRSNKWVMKEKKKTKCCYNWKLIFVLFIVVIFLFLSITKKNTVEDGKFLCSCVQPLKLS